MSSSAGLVSIDNKPVKSQDVLYNLARELRVANVDMREAEAKGQDTSTVALWVPGLVKDWAPIREWLIWVYKQLATHRVGG